MSRTIPPSPIKGRKPGRKLRRRHHHQERRQTRHEIGLALIAGDQEAIREEMASPRIPWEVQS